MLTGLFLGSPFMRLSIRLSFAFLLLPCVAHAAPTARFTWQLETLAGCYRAVSDQYVQDGANVGVGVTGLAEPFTAYALDIEIAAQDGQPLPDAWRYDAAGCRGPSGVRGRRTSHRDRRAASSTISRRARAGNIDHVRRLAPAPRAAARGRRAGRSVPGRRVAGRDRAVAVVGGSCAGATIRRASSCARCAFRRPDGSWFEADRPTPVITLNAASLDGPAACAAVPARAATWGALKGL
jgi:hypothetical protein